MRFIGSLTPTCARPASSTEMISTPMKVLMTEPRPPIRLVPPMTTAAITCNSMPTPPFGSAASRRDTWNSAPTPDSKPISAYTSTLRGRGAMPDRRTASSLVPMPIQWRPSTLLVSTSWPATTMASAIKIAGDRPNTIGALIGHLISQAAGDFQHAQRDDERGNPPADRDQAGGRAADGGGGHAEQARGPHRPAPVHRGQRQDGRGQRHHRADRQVDAADDQHEGHADRHHDQRRNVIGQRGQRG